MQHDRDLRKKIEETGEKLWDGMGVEGGTWKDLENVEAGRNCKGAGLWGSGDYEFFNYAVLGLVFSPLLKE